MNKYAIKDLIDEETDDVEVPIDQCWESAGKPIGDRTMNEYDIYLEANAHPTKALYYHYYQNTRVHDLLLLYSIFCWG